MTPDIILTLGNVTATSHYHCHVTRCQLDPWKIFNFKKRNSKNL